MSNLNQVTTELTCQKCPEIKGDTWCRYKNQGIWKKDEMCERGYLARIERGVEMCYKIKNDGERYNKIVNQCIELERIWEEKYGGTEIQQPELIEPEVPF